MNEAYCIKCHGPMSQASDGQLLCNDTTCPNSHPEPGKIEKSHALGFAPNGKGWPP